MSCLVSVGFLLLASWTAMSHEPEVSAQSELILSVRELDLYCYYFLCSFSLLSLQIWCMSLMDIMLVVVSWWWWYVLLYVQFRFWQNVMNLSGMKSVSASSIIFCGNPYSPNTILQHFISCSADRLFILFTIGNLLWWSTVQRKWLLLKWIC